MPPRQLLAVWIALCALVPVGAYMVNGSVIALAIIATGVPAVSHWRAWLRLRGFGLFSSAIMLLILWLGLTAVFAVDPGESGSKAIRLFGLFFLSVAAVSAADASNADTARRMGLSLSIALGAMVVLVGIELGLGGIILRQAKDYPRELIIQGLDMTLTKYTQWRVVHTLARSAVFLTVLGPLAIYAATRTSYGLRAACALAIGIIVIVFALPTQMAQITLVITALVAVIAWYMPRIMHFAMTVGLLGTLMALPPIAMAIDPGQPAGIDVRTLHEGLQHRLAMWHFAAERIGERPWIGWGLESSRAMPGGDTRLTLYKDGAPDAEVTVVLPLHPHNATLQIWLEGGAIGAMILGAAFMGLGQLLIRLRRDRALYAAAVSSTAALIIFAQASVGLWQEWFLALIALTAVFTTALARARRNQSS